MVRNEQVKNLRRLIAEGMPLYRAAWKTGMSPKTARKYRRLKRLPSEVAPRHDWRTREDPFAMVWNRVQQQLEHSPGVQAKALFEWLQREFPSDFDDGQLRSFQRRVKQWRATSGPKKEVSFLQSHRPGELAASDFTDMSELKITLAGESHHHKIFHFAVSNVISPVSTRRPRSQDRAGLTRWNEDEYFCRKCRKSFFPSDVLLGIEG